MSKSALIQAFESAPNIDGRYSGLFCVNFRPGAPRKERGGYSLVFRAHDSTLGHAVAIKIMDPDFISDIYRLDCFTREPQILAGIQGHSRCLRLVEGHKVFDIDVTISPGSILKYPVGFFVTEWLAEHIEDFFFKQNLFTPLARLQAFRQIVLAVKAHHDQNVHHRDLKRDNFRVRVSQPDKPIVTIDFGTAAKLESPHLAAHYGTPVGHHGYAPPEAFTGLAGLRQLGKLSDSYALGALLYELFMPNFFFLETLSNPVFVSTLSATLHRCNREPDITKRFELWKVLVKGFAKAVQPPSISGTGSGVPSAVKSQIVSLYDDLAAFDLSKRLSRMDEVVRRVDSAIRCISNQIFWQSERERRRKARAKRLSDLLAKEARIRALRGS